MPTPCRVCVEQTGDARFGYDAYRRFIQLFGKVALNVPDELFDAEFDAVKQKAHVTADVGLSADDLKEISERFLRVFEEHTGRAFPEDPYDQLEIAIKAVFGSWMGKRPVDYRREFNITPGDGQRHRSQRLHPWSSATAVMTPPRGVRLHPQALVLVRTSCLVSI